MTAVLVKPPHRPQWIEPSMLDHPSVFLAGTIDMGNSRDWQQEAFEALGVIPGPVIVYNPRRDEWDSSWVQDISNPTFREQVEWELEHIDLARHVLMHFEPTSQSPITLLELGIIAASAPGKLIVSCPDGYWRRGNVQIVCSTYGIRLTDSIDTAIEELVRRIG